MAEVQWAIYFSYFSVLRFPFVSSLYFLYFSWNFIFLYCVCLFPVVSSVFIIVYWSVSIISVLKYLLNYSNFPVFFLLSCTNYFFISERWWNWNSIFHLQRIWYTITSFDSKNILLPKSWKSASALCTWGVSPLEILANYYLANIGASPALTKRTTKPNHELNKMEYVLNYQVVGCFVMKQKLTNTKV